MGGCVLRRRGEQWKPDDYDDTRYSLDRAIYKTDRWYGMVWFSTRRRDNGINNTTQHNTTQRYLLSNYNTISTIGTVHSAAASESVAT